MKPDIATAAGGHVVGWQQLRNISQALGELLDSPWGCAQYSRCGNSGRRICPSGSCVPPQSHAGFSRWLARPRLATWAKARRLGNRGQRGVTGSGF